MQLQETELLYLRRCVMIRLETVSKQLDRNRLFFRDTDDDILYQRKIGTLETEQVILLRVKDSINGEIAKTSLDV